MKTSSPITIFEGPDGCGKTTAAKAFATRRGARYVHLGAFPRVTDGLARLYVEAMLPALLGYQEVVLDRSWLSEMPYGEVHREGRDRLTLADRRMLERLALRGGGSVVRCLTSWETAEQNFLKRRSQELLPDAQRLRRVYNLYRSHFETALPVVTYNYQEDELFTDLLSRRPCHPLSLATAGAWDAEILLVGEALAERKNHDPLYQAPFVSFAGEGCSRWLTHQLADVGISESEILWVNADQDLSFIHSLDHEPRVIALGQSAAAELYRHKIKADVVEHPQSWKRFHAREPYPLKELLRGLR